jgi:hypothetical protein
MQLNIEPTNEDQDLSEMLNNIWKGLTRHQRQIVVSSAHILMQANLLDEHRQYEKLTGQIGSFRKQ